LDLRLFSRNKARIITVEEPTITKSKKGVAGPEYNKEYAHCFFFQDEGDLFTVNLFLLTLWSTLWHFEMPERKRATNKTRTLVQPHLDPSRQRACPRPLKITEFVTNNNMVIISHPPYLPDLAPCDFAPFPKLKMKLE
jgi:hypothetical protein